MAELVPAVDAPAPSLLAPLTDPAGGPALTRIGSFVKQPAVRKTLPWFGGMAGIGMAALAWATLAPQPQRTLYSQLDDGERAKVAESLEKAGIAYSIDNSTGALSVGEDDLYKARMLVASDGALASPDDGANTVENLPLGASRAVEGDRLRAAREHDLTLSIMEIDGVEAVRVHLAEAEKSVFVRDNVAPTASVMVRLARGRQLADGQVAAIVNLVAGSIPGLSPDAVRVVDQHGRLLTERASGSSERLELQGRMEEKLRAQLDQLLTPMVGAGNFSSEVQVDLDMDQVTSARESYDKQGVLRTETQQQSQTTGGATPAAGVPGVTSNTPTPQATASPGPPQATQVPAAAPAQNNGESSATRTYELGREVAVSNGAPGKIRRLSVAVALSSEALKKAKPQDVEQLKQLVSAAVGADPARGDQVAVVMRAFEATPVEALPMWQQAWFMSFARIGAALLGVLLVLLLGVRPLIKALKRDGAPSDTFAEGDEDEAEAEGAVPAPRRALSAPPVDAEALGQQVGLARRIVMEQPDDAVLALREMLNPPAQEAAA
jgi:flagellar M-ring protein FliF